jgi:hypothetical protein
MIEARVYSNIGFRSESSIKEFEKYKTREKTNPLAINDAYAMVKRFDSILAETGVFHMGRTDEEAYLTLLKDGFEEKKLTTITIRTTKIALEKMLKNKEVSEDEIRIGLNLFTEISAKCKEYVIEQRSH